MLRWLAAASIVAALAIAMVAGTRFYLPADEAASSDQQGAVPIGGPFTLTDQTGRRVTEADYRGRLMLVYFGYTFCPDVCPLGLQTVAAALDELPADVQDQVVPLFITVDPERDTVPVMRDYVAAFHPRLVGLTGSEADVAATLRAYRVYASRSAAPAGDDGYLVDHSTFTYLMDRQGRYLAHFGHDTTPDAMAKRIAELVAAG